MPFWEIEEAIKPKQKPKTFIPADVRLIIKWLIAQADSKYSGGKKNLMWNKENKNLIKKWVE